MTAVLLIMTIVANGGAVFSSRNNLAAAGAANLRPLAYTLHDFTLDTLGKTLLMSDDAADRAGDLKESVSGTVVQDWHVNYAQKGSSRSQCRPPVLNITFASGTPQDKFHGLTTYGAFSELKYKKVRLIPECDIWNDYWVNSGGGTAGFNGQLNVSLREFIVFKTFRAFGIPAMDIVGFANVSFVTSDPGYAGQIYRYMMVQRDDEPKDQQPFTTQFSLSPTLYESSDIEGGNVPWTYRMDNRLTTATILNKSDNSIVRQLSFDPDTTMKTFLLTDFLNVDDMGPLHNEDWGISNITGKAEIISHGFDASFRCSLGDPSYANVANLINGLPSDIRPSYQLAYYNIARSIFGDPASLDQMIESVNEFPYGDVDKSKLIEFLRLRFYQYASYFNSAAFASAMGQTYQPLAIDLPFASLSEYNSHASSFINSCAVATGIPSGLSVSMVGSSTLEHNVPAPVVCPAGFTCNQDNQGNLVTASFTVDVRNSGTSTLQVSKSGAFTSDLVGIGSGNSYINMQYGAPISGAIDQPGPYYLILPNSTARFILSGSVSGTSLVRDTYYVQLDHFQPNYRITPYVLNVRTNSLALGDVEPIVVISPRSGDQLITGSTSTIRWSGNLGRAAQISLEGPSWYNVTEPDRQEAYANNEYDWNVGKVYSYNGTQWVISDMQPGRYRVIVRDYRSGVSSGSGYFTVADSAHMPPSVKVIIGSTTPSLSLIYDQAGGESRLAANFIVDLSAGSSDQMIGTSGYFSASMRNDTDTAFGYGSTAYDKPANVDLSLDGMMYVIHASTTARFNVRAEFNPQIMFAGTYRASLTGVSLTDDSSGWEYLTIPPNQTNAVTIIGEKSPYINSISPASANSNEQVTIDGLRFAASGNILTLYDEFPPEKGEKTTPTVLMVGSTNGGRTIKFVPNLPASRYWMTITDPVNGTSNGVDLTIQDTPLSIAFDNPTLISGQTVNMSFGIPNDLAAEKLYLSCPDGVFATWFKYGDHVSSGASEVCNTWVNFTPPSVRSLALVMSNYSSSTKTVSPNLYSYFKDNPTFAHGKAEVFTVAPAVTFSPSARPSIQVIYPNGGQEYDFFKSQVFVLNWATVNIPSTNKIRVNLNNEDTGVSYLISPGIDNDGSARLSVFAGRTLPAGRYSLELLSTVDNTGYYDLSDGYLNINPGATTTVPVVQTPATSTVPVNATSTSASGPSSKNPIVPVSNNTGGINGVSPIVSPTPSPSPSASPSFSPSPSPSSSPSPSPSASPSPSPSPSPIYSPSPSPSSSPVTNTRKGYQRATIWDALKTILGL